MAMNYNKPHLRNMSTRLGGFRLTKRIRRVFLWDHLNWGWWLVLESKNPRPVHVKDLCQSLLVSLPCRRACCWIRIFLLFPTFSQHIMSIIEVHSRSVRDKSVQLVSREHNQITKNQTNPIKKKQKQSCPRFKITHIFLGIPSAQKLFLKRASRLALQVDRRRR